MQKKTASSPKTKQRPALQTTFWAPWSLRILSHWEGSSSTHLLPMTWEGASVLSTPEVTPLEERSVPRSYQWKGGYLPWGAWGLRWQFFVFLRGLTVCKPIHWQIVGEETICLPTVAGLPRLKRLKKLEPCESWRSTKPGQERKMTIPSRGIQSWCEGSPQNCKSQWDRTDGTNRREPWQQQQEQRTLRKV